LIQFHLLIRWEKFKLSPFLAFEKTYKFCLALNLQNEAAQAFSNDCLLETGKNYAKHVLTSKTWKKSGRQSVMLIYQETEYFTETPHIS
jgi:hypothetical protein